ncbi:MAG: signal peptidase I [Oscillospiraceae bacterium]|nr:signal peptidase I [Oscillospiraceae bacterium]
MSKAKKRLKLVGRVALILLISLLVGFRLYSWNARAIGGNLMPMPFGWGVSVVLSGSMEPALSVDDLVLLHSVETYEVGDIVVYQEGTSSLVIHRIVSIDGETVVTMGDNNDAPDDPINMKAIKGKAVASIPFVGIVVNFLQSTLGFLLILIAAILLFELPYLMQRKKATDEQEKIKEEIRKLKGE